MQPVSTTSYCLSASMAVTNAARDTKELDQEIACGIQQAITESLDKFTLDQTPTQTSVGAKTRRQTSATVNAGEISVAEIVTEVVKALQPMIVQCVTSAVSQAVTIIADKFVGDVSNTTTSSLKKQLKQQSYQLDRMEQYTRRDNVIIKGVSYSDNENTNDIVMKLASDAGVELSKDDISTSHRLGVTRDNSKPSPIIVRLSKRDKKIELMKKKKNIRQGVYVEEDLTKLRGNMAYEVRKNSNTIKTWTINGKIYALVNEGGTEVKKVFETPDDLYKLGWTETRLEAFLDVK